MYIKKKTCTTIDNSSMCSQMCKAEKKTFCNPIYNSKSTVDIQTDVPDQFPWMLLYCLGSQCTI